TASARAPRYRTRRHLARAREAWRRGAWRASTVRMTIIRRHGAARRDGGEPQCVPAVRRRHLEPDRHRLSAASKGLAGLSYGPRKPPLIVRPETVISTAGRNLADAAE